MQQIMKLFGKPSLGRRFLLSLLLVIVIPLLILIMVFQNSVSKEYFEQACEINLEILKQSRESIESFANDIEFVSKNILGDTQVQEYLKIYGGESNHNAELGRIGVSYTIQPIMQCRPNISAISIFDAERIYCQFGVLVNSENTEHLEEVEALKGKGLWIPAYQYENPMLEKHARTYVVSFMRAINDLYAMRQLAIERITIDESDLCALYSGLNSEGSTIFIVDQNNKIVSSTDKSMLGTVVNRDRYIKAENGQSEGWFCEAETVYSFYHLKHPDWTVVRLEPASHFTSGSKNISWAFYLCLLLTGIFALLFYRIQQRTIIRPVQAMAAQAERFRNGTNKIEMCTTGNDEIAVLNQAFVDMSVSIKQLIEQEYKSKLYQKEIELAYMQSQVNPHFLYNTLESIRWMAVLHQQPEIADQIEALSKLFRLVLNEGNSTTTVAKELEHVDVYMKLMQNRFGEKLQYEKKVDPELLECRVLHLVLQPFVFGTQENVSYIKLVSKKMSCEGNENSYRFQLMELKAFYDPNVKPPVPEADPVEIDLTGSNVTVSSKIEGADAWAPANAVDGNLNLGWSSDGPRTTPYSHEWIQIELQEAATMSRVVLVPRFGHGNNQVEQFLCFPEDFTIQVSADGNNWDTVVEKTGYKASNQSGEVLDFSTDKANVKFIKIDATKLAHEGNTDNGAADGKYNSFRFQLMEIKAYYTPHTLDEIADSITGLVVDYTNECVVMPTLPGITNITIVSSSNPDAVALDGSVDVVNGGTSQVVLELKDDKGNTSRTGALTVTVTGLLESLAAAAKITTAKASSSHEAWPDTHLFNGDASFGFWSTGDNAPEEVTIDVTLENPEEVVGVILYPRVAPADSSGNTLFPKYFTISVSADGSDWEKVKSVNGYETNNSTAPQKFTFSAQPDVQHVRFTIDRRGSYVQLAELEVLALPETQTAAEAAAALTVSDPELGDTSIAVENVSGLFRTAITNTSPAGIIASNGTITYPAENTEVTLTIQVTNRLDEDDVATATRTILVKTPASQEAEAAAKTVDLIPCPGNTDTRITLPALDGYTVTIADSSHPNVVSADGTITRSDDTTYGVRLTLKVTNNETGAHALTKPLLVPIYKTYVAPTMSQDEIDRIHEEYEDNAYGVFVHYISAYDWGASVYADGTQVKTVDEAAEAFDAAAFAKSMDEFGVEYVVLTMWHGDTRPLFPSMTSQRWRDDRRAADSTTKKSYADRDVIMDLLNELDKYGIDLHLYTHPCDGHDFTAEDQILTGWNDSANNYATWNQFINELYYEVCERYGTRIKGLWFDGVYNHVPIGEAQARLRQTCLSFNPAMILTMNTGFTEGTLDPAPGHNCPDYRSWEVNRYVDFVNDMKFSRHQSAIVIASQGWWTTRAQNKTFPVQSAEDMFQYLVAMSSVSTHGGFLASTGFYPVHEGEVLDNYFMNGIYDALKKVNTNYLEPVAESIKGTANSTAYPTTENITVSELTWGVANESKDGRYVYLHVLNAPEGSTLTLPATADGTTLRSDAVIMNFDGTTTPVTITQTNNGYEITLPEGASWSTVDTVIRAQRSSVTGVTLDQTALALKVGGTVVLTAEMTPDTAYDKTVSWTSSDTTVATVDSTGLVTAVSVGTAAITVTTEDGGKTATCTVTVTANKAALQELYGQYVGTEKGIYTDETWTAFQKALDAAKKVLADEEATQEEVDAALAALSDAKDGLTEKTVIIDPNPTPKPDTKPNTKPDNTAPFRDVKESDWYSDAVAYVYENGLMNGTGKNTFSPLDNTTRGMIVTILYRQSGSPKVSSDNKTWWSDARVWAMECGISDGTNMDGNITREQLAAMLYRYAKLTGADVSARGNLNKFTDRAEVSDWATEAVQWAVGEGILGGRSDGTLDPNGLATRAEVAAMFMRFCRNVIKK